jgi:lysozyme family protein
MNFDVYFDRLISHEGGYVWHPHDPGGETKFGISKRAYPNIDIKNLTREQAKEIYKRDYWDRARLSELDKSIAFQVFDIAVNSGIGTAIRMLQRAVNVADDGVIGPVTVAAVGKLPVYSVLMSLAAERLFFYTKLTTWSTFGKGWTKRVADNLKHAVDDL